eukprot:CAMPEP_0195075268 /NCGR_PEP_ID=MMETSP0448-20130528/18177_1 /TAXON_ID=66468 /ORGANISM="Heterocapsa triquestra, Strain CCMP 448" /LENGTH=725 /DNA_ID=CAMNT_0040107635 /DNA_START=3 /DNA_END=2180 /DNA_ORIENTATION=+
MGVVAAAAALFAIGLLALLSAVAAPRAVESLRGRRAAAEEPTSAAARVLQAPIVDVPAAGQIRWNNHPTKCFDVMNGSPQNGNRVQLWDCNGSNNQQFTWDAVDKKIHWAAHPGMCLDIKDHKTQPGTYAQLWACSQANTDQAFAVAASGQGNIRWASHPTLCLDVKDHSTHNGNLIQIWDCQSSNSDQTFTLSDGSSAPTDTPPTLAPTAGPAETYDIIFVGAGLMGSATAARLAEKLPTHKLLVLEAGKASHKSLGGDEPPASLNSDGSWQEWPGMGHDVTRYDVPGNYPSMDCWNSKCAQSWGKELPFFQCKILGGCGVMNGALQHIPLETNFAHWPRGWRWADLSSYFAEVRRLFSITEAPSADGRHYLDDTGANAFHFAMKGAGMKHGDILKPVAGSMGIPQVTASGGLRQSTASVFLPAALKRSNFKLRLQSKVVEILRDGARATGVLYEDASGARHVAALAEGGVVVLAGGSMNTPRLLLASGVGPAGAVHNAEVGRGISDHAHLSAWFSVDSDEVAEFAARPPAMTTIREYSSHRAGGLAQYGPTYAAYVRDPSTAGAPEDWDVEVWITPSTTAGRVAMGFVLMRPTCSSGDLAIAGWDNHVELPRNRLHLACERDRQTMQYALDLVQRHMANHGGRLVGTSPSSVNGRIEKANSMNHWVAGCAIGRCTDPKTLRVRGTDNIAVADASLLPDQVWGHPAYTLQAVGLKVGDMLASSL